MFTPWEVNKFKDFLKNEQEYLDSKVTTKFAQSIIDSVIGILQQSLDREMAIADKDFKDFVKAVEK